MRSRRLAVVMLIAFAAAGAAYLLTTLRVFDGIFGEAERRTIDYRISSQLPHEDSSGIKLVLFDTASVAQWPYLQPFPRAFLADVINAAAANGAAAIGLDVFLGQQYPQLSKDDNGDARLREAIERAGNVVLVAPTEGTDTARHLVRPDPYFADVAAAVGSADMPTAMDVLRDGTLAVPTKEGLVPSFSLALYAVGSGRSLDSLLAAAQRDGQLRLPGLPARYRKVRQDGAMTFPIRFVGPPSKTGSEEVTFPAYEAGILAAMAPMGRVDAIASWMNGSIVLVGSGFHEQERFRTAFYDVPRESTGEIFGWMYGVESHANALQNIKESNFLQPLATPWVLLLLYGIALGAGGAVFWKGAKWGALAALVTFALVWWLGLEAMYRANLVIPVIGSALAAAFAFTGSAAYVSIVEGREKRMIRGAFSKYVPPGVVDDLVADPSKLKLGGEKRTISILFSDVAGFTSMSEVLSPETLVSVLNEYLDEMSDIVFDEKGTLDKYIGDAIMALYGAPTTLPGHELHACRTALRMQQRLGELNTQWQSEGKNWPKLKIRIGLNTGTPVVGNIGGERRFDYTALGDAVNLAARLEPACKTYGVRIMMAENTRQGVGDAVIARELDMLAVYGKAEPVPVYELVALAGEDIGEKRELLELYEKGLRAYRSRDFELAIQYFDAALQLDASDGPSRLYRQRSEEYMVNPPPADWDFVERRQIK